MAATPACLLLMLCILSTSAADTGGQVLKVVDLVDGRFVPDISNLRSIVASVDADTEVAVIAIAGEYRKGKSFLMNFFLQYLSQRQHAADPLRTHDQDQLQTLVSSRNHPWLRDMDRDTGFQFKSGRERHTTGVTIWSKPFVVRKANDQRLAILLMDSQGLYDASTSQDDNVRLFTMVSLLSSSLLLNVPQNINLKQLMELKYFMDYATTGSDVVKGQKAFQRLTFLIRDYTLEETYGWAGGQEEINQFMKPHATENAEVAELAANLTKGFEKIDGFTLPPPGRHVVRRDFDGTLQKIDPSFLFHLENLVVNISEGAETRKPFVIPLKAGTLVQHVEKLVDSFNRQESPAEMMRMKERELVSKGLHAVQQQLQAYDDQMPDMLAGKPDSFFLQKSRESVVQDMRNKHREAVNRIMRTFGSSWAADLKITRAANGDAQDCEEHLRQELEKKFRDKETKLRLDFLRKKTQAEARKRDEEVRRERQRQLERERRRLQEEQRQLRQEREQEEARWRRWQRQVEEERRRCRRDFFCRVFG